jgi:hypothetical protein
MRSCYSPTRLWFAAWICLLSQQICAQTDEIEVYDAVIAAPGVVNLTWHNNYTPNGRDAPEFPGGIVPDHSLNGVTEWAYGVTP